MRDHLARVIPRLQPFGLLVQELARLDPGKHVSVDGVAGSFRAILLACLSEILSRQLLVVVQDRESAERLRDDLAVLLGNDGVRSFGGQGLHVLSDPAAEISDVQVLRALALDHVPVIVTHVPCLLSPLPQVRAVAQRSFSFTIRQEQLLSRAIAKLEEFAFQKKDFVETVGDYAVRGGILDVFPFVGEHPIRVEFSGDSIESIREFDPLSQRSIKDLSTGIIVPDLLAHPEHQGEETDDRHASILDYLRPDAVVMVDDRELLGNALREIAMRGDSPAVAPEEVEDLLTLFPQIDNRTWGGPSGETCDFRAVPQPAFNGSVRIVRAALREYQAQQYAIIITCDGHAELARLKELLAAVEHEVNEGAAAVEEQETPGIDLSRIEFSLEALHEGFIVPEARVAVITEHQIFNRLKRHGRKRQPRFKGFSEKELNALRKGDFVVHADYGIGRFDGLRKIRVSNVEQEVVRVLYEENDTLYVNLNYLNKLQKYSSREGHIPRLTRLGSPDWDRLKARAKKRVKDIARDLIALYAKRKHMAGYAFQTDTPWQKELEASFMYEDTFDQAKATREVKDDMEAVSPMDRLICGDVGFGKTEVAVRAAFKAVLSGRQVAVLVPTTILAVQHYNTFIDRTHRYGVNIQALSRFKTKKEQAVILEGLKAGGVDIIIGTHRLLSKDVGFKNLGLLIVDEEHRFGVSAKEKLRQLRAEVDTLALTATPIPRTLHFSLMGARDLSIIATAPRNRLPVITEITQWNDDLIREAAQREIHRGGQVYFVHDRVQNIAEITERLRKILPGARIGIAHGQMRAHELEDVMMAFLEKRLDVLASTKIIESGLDIPNVNTIVINRADRFGMAELYQLRGRVGRSNVQAYCYLLVPPISVLPRTTIQRLQAVQDFTELGSGFNLAMRDLEIRGAGNLLGSEQSGFIETMGFETYTRVLEEAVRELKEQEFQDLFEREDGSIRSVDVVVEAEFDALIPEEYIANDMERLSVYRRLYAVQTPVQTEEVEDELKDRFGKLPAEVENLLGVVRLRMAASKAGFPRVHVSERALELEFPPESEGRFYESEKFQRIMSSISTMKERGSVLKQGGKTLKLLLPLQQPYSSTNALLQARTLLVDLTGEEPKVLPG